MLPLLVVLASELLVGIPPPLVTITSWLPAEQFVWETNEMAPLTEVNTIRSLYSQSYAVPANVAGLLVVCNATYPIQWNFVTQARQGDGRRPDMSQLVRTSRKADDLFENSAYEYIAELRLQGDDNTLTGNYTCTSSDESRTLYYTLYFFWEGNSPPYLLGYGTNTSIYVGTEKKQESITLPCRISDPTVAVVLEKDVNHTWVKADHPANWSYNPAVGFVAHAIEKEQFLGSYRCATDSLEDDVAFFNVLPGPEPNKTDFREIMLNNASFGYHEENKKFVCCSNSWRRPSFQLIYCDNPMLCRALRLSLDAQQTRVNHGRRILGSSCTSIKLLYQTSGIVKCVGDGIQVYREYFFEQTVGIARLVHHSKFKIPLGITGHPHYHWTDTDPVNMISVVAESQRVFAGDTIRVSCEASTYYFAQGVKWLLTWKNNSHSVLEGIENTFFLKSALFLHPGYSYLSILVDADLSSVSCYAPVWNSSEWVHKNLELDVMEPMKPTIDGSATELKAVEMHWYLNETRKWLECTIAGNPPPTITWEHNDKVLTESRRVNGTSMLLVVQVNDSTNGIYSCTAENLAGSVTKTFHIVIEKRMSQGETAGICLGVLIAVLLLSAFILLVRHMKTQSNSIQHLKTVAFKDVMNRTVEEPPHINFPFPSPNTNVGVTVSVSDVEFISTSTPSLNQEKQPKFNLAAAVNQNVVYEKF